MVTVLPEIPSFSQSVARQLGGGISQGIGKGIDLASEMSLQKQKGEQKESFFKELLGSQKKESTKESSEQLMGGKKEFSLTPEQETMLALTHPQEFTAYKHLKEERAKEKESTQKQENLKETLSEMSKTLLENNLGKTPNRFLTAKGRRDAQYFDSLGVQLESIGKDMVSKGVLSQARFAYLLSNLPSSDKTDASNAGALEAWHKELGFPAPEGIEKLYGGKSKKSTLEMMDAKGNVYDIPKHLQDKARQQGLK